MTQDLTHADPALDGREEVFRRLYAEHFTTVLAFALRRVDHPEDAADVAADTFLVTWRRLGHVPSGEETRPWLYGVARRVLANQRRGEGRRTSLTRRLREELRAVVSDSSDEVVQRADVTTAMCRLSGRDQEILELHLWEGLEPREIAEVLGLATVVVRPRLSRARGRLRDVLGNDPPPPGHQPSRQPQLTGKEK